MYSLLLSFFSTIVIVVGCCCDSLLLEGVAALYFSTCVAAPFLFYSCCSSLFFVCLVILLNTSEICHVFIMQVDQVLEEIDVQPTAPTESSQKLKRTMCCFYCHASGQSKRTCTCCQAQAWRNRMGTVKRRKEKVTFLRPQNRI